MYPPAKHDFNNSVSLNALSPGQQQAQWSWCTLALIYNFILIVYSEHQYRHFRLCGNWLTLFNFILVTAGVGPHKWIGLGPHISYIRSLRPMPFIKNIIGKRVSLLVKTKIRTGVHFMSRFFAKVTTLKTGRNILSIEIWWCRFKGFLIELYSFLSNVNCKN